LPIQGVGLGLTITKLLTQILGGELAVTSTPGVGTRFCVRLLLPEARGHHLAPTRRNGGCSVIRAVDGWTVAERLRRIFDRQKIVVNSANAAGLRRPPDVVSYHDDFMFEPIGVSDLMARIGTPLPIEWNAQASEPSMPAGPAEVAPEIQLDHKRTISRPRNSESFCRSAMCAASICCWILSRSKIPKRRHAWRTCAGSSRASNSTSSETH
jgi:hypothetical protein